MGTYAAGILPYIKIDNDVYVLLGKDRRNKWSDFGGKSELRDNENKKYTAAREFFEETCGCISNLFKTSNTLNTRFVKLLKGKSYTKKEYYMYLVDARALMAPDEIMQLTTKFDKIYSYLRSVDVDPKFIEKNKLKWINTSSLFDNTAFDNLRQVFYNTINIPSNKRILQNL